MVELVDERGYKAVTTRELARISGVSTRAFYKHFDSKEDCFLRTYELVIRRWVKNIVAARARESDWKRQLRAATEAFGRELARRPGEGRFALVGIYSIGPEALDFIWRTERSLEASVSESLDHAPGRTEMPPSLIEGIVIGMVSVARSRLLTKREDELLNLTDTMTDWMSCFACELVTDLLELDKKDPYSEHALLVADHCADSALNSGAQMSDRDLIFAALAKLVTSQIELTPQVIHTAAGISRRRFDAQFKSVEDCLLTMLDMRIEQALTSASSACANQKPTGGQAIYRAISTFCACIAIDPVLSRINGAGRLTLGSRGLERRERYAASISQLLHEGLPTVYGSHAPFTEMTGYAIWGLIHRYLARGQVRQLYSSSPAIVYLALAPAIGGIAATEAMRGGKSLGPKLKNIGLKNLRSRCDTRNPPSEKNSALMRSLPQNRNYSE